MKKSKNKPKSLLQSFPVVINISPCPLMASAYTLVQVTKPPGILRLLLDPMRSPCTVDRAPQTAVPQPDRRSSGRAWLELHCRAPSFHHGSHAPRRARRLSGGRPGVRAGGAVAPTCCCCVLALRGRRYDRERCSSSTTLTLS